MKTLTVLLTVILFIQTSGYLIKVPTESVASQIVINQSQRMNLQKLMIPLFDNVCEPSSDATICTLAEEFKMDPGDYTSSQAVTKFLDVKSSGLLSKGSIFTEYDINHMNELQTMYEILYSANNFEVFYKTAAWARQNLNCALYMNAIYMAILNRRDTEQLYIPAPYELLPNYFIEKNVFKKAYSIIDGNNISLTESIRMVENCYIIDANYTASFYDNEDDSKLAYFREDIGLNSYSYLRKLRMLSWLNSNTNSNIGENMYQMMKQLSARYNLERYANGLPEVDGIIWNSTIDLPYDPMLIYSDGNEFSHRTLPLNLPENEDLITLQSIENNVSLIVSRLLQTGYNKTQILNYLIELLITNERSYVTLAHQHLGKNGNNNGYPSVLDHYMTSLRDPIFWNINKNVVDLIDDALKILPPYTREELYFPGVEIISIDVKKMTTAYDFFEFEVTEALKIENKNSTFRIKIGQPRLNHKKFNIKINISSTMMQKGIIKIYLGPKLKLSELVKNKNLFTLLDVFEVNLKIGSNVISRSSDNMNHFSEDFMSINTIKNKIEDAEFGLDSLPLKTIQSQIGYPSRLILPKGTPEGLPLQMFIFIAPYFKVNLFNSFYKNSIVLNTAALSPGYPLDLMITDQKLFELPNAIVKSVNVIQKSDSKVENYGGPGITKSWYSHNTYGSYSQENYNTETGEYGAKKYYSFKTNVSNNKGNSYKPEKENLALDNLNVVDLKDASPIPKAVNFDHIPINRRQFDYKIKKAQYENKGVTYEKPDEGSIPLISVTEYFSVNKNDEMVFDTNREPHHNILQNIENLNKNDMNEQLIQLESLPSPAMLITDVEDNDYGLKKKERDLKVKMIKAELDNLIKEAKKNNRNLIMIDAKIEDPVNKDPLSSDLKIFNSKYNLGQEVFDD